MLKILAVSICLSFFVGSVFAENNAGKNQVYYTKETKEGFLCGFFVTEDNTLFVAGGDIGQATFVDDLEFEPSEYFVVVTANTILNPKTGEIGLIEVVLDDPDLKIKKEDLVEAGDTLVSACLLEIPYLPKDVLVKIGYKTIVANTVKK